LINSLDDRGFLPEDVAQQLGIFFPNIENNFQEDDTVFLPEVLREFVGTEKIGFVL
jgi:hypothetical protein